MQRKKTNRQRVSAIAPADRLTERAHWAGLDPTKTGPKGERLAAYSNNNRRTPWTVAVDGATYRATDAAVRELFGVSQIDGGAQ